MHARNSGPGTRRDADRYLRPGGLWDALRRARANGKKEETERLKELINRLSEERVRLWTTNPTSARRLTRRLNGDDHDVRRKETASEVTLFFGDPETLRPELNDSNEASAWRARQRLRHWKKSRKRYGPVGPSGTRMPSGGIAFTKKDRRAVRGPLWDDYGIVCPGLVGLGICHSWPDDPNGARYPVGTPFKRDSEYDRVERKPATKRANATEETKQRIREFVLPELCREIGARMPSVREVSRHLNTTNRERVGRLMNQVTAELLTEYRSAKASESTNQYLRHLDVKLDLLIKHLGADAKPALRLVISEQRNRGEA